MAEIQEEGENVMKRCSICGETVEQLFDGVCVSCLVDRAVKRINSSSEYDLYEVDENMVRRFKVADNLLDVLRQGRMTPAGN